MVFFLSFLNVLIFQIKIPRILCKGKNEDGHSDELLKLGIGSWRLQCLVADFKSFLAEIVGDGTMQKFKTDFTNCFSDMIRHLKSKLHWQGTNEFRISDYPPGTV